MPSVKLLLSLNNQQKYCEGKPLHQDSLLDYCQYLHLNELRFELLNKKRSPFSKKERSSSFLITGILSVPKQVPDFWELSSISRADFFNLQRRAQNSIAHNYTRICSFANFQLSLRHRFKQETFPRKHCALKIPIRNVCNSSNLQFASSIDIPAHNSHRGFGSY
jgi:hypothetical protein